MILWYIVYKLSHARVQGGERIRKSHFVKGDELVKYRFEDSKTLYELFQRGKRESSELRNLS